MGIRNEDCELCDFGTADKKPRNRCLVPHPEDITRCDVMIVAEQPSIQDDTQGVIFCGKSMADIRRFFTDQGIKVYCTYALKCPRPDPKIKPKTKQLKACAPEYLRKEIELVKPKHIITLGANAYYGVVGKPAGSVRAPGGRYYEESLGAYMYPTLHQLQTTFNKQAKATLYADLARFAGWISGRANKHLEFNPPVRVAATLKSLRTLQRRIREAGGIVAVDTETQGLNPYIVGKSVRCIQFCWDAEEGGVFVPLDLEEDCYFTDKDQAHSFWQNESLDDAIEIIREILWDSRCIWHNGKFDRLWLYMWGLRRFGEPILAPKIFMDTLTVAHQIDENRILKLKQLITSELGYPTYDIKNKLTKDLDELIPYATKDTVATLLLAQKYAGILQDEDMARIRALYVNVLRPMDHLLTKIELRGWPIDYEQCIKLKKAIDIEFAEIDAQMHAMLLGEGIDLGNDSSHFSSPIKLAKILFDGLGYSPNPDKSVALTEGGALATGVKALVHINHKPFVKLLFKWRSLAKTLSTYVLPMIDACLTRGRLTTSYRLHGTATGRTASGKENERQSSAKDRNGMNLQNLPYDTFGEEKLKVRDCIVAQEGWKIIEVDFSQIELRVAGMVSRDVLFHQLYRDDQDVHSMRGMRVAGYSPEEWEKLPKETKKDLRQKAKAVNFGLIYGMKEHGLQQYALTDYGVELTYKECVEIRRQFFADHYALPGWYKRQEKEALAKGFVESMSGRRRRLPNIKFDPETSREAKMKYEEAIRMAINTPVQGFASDLKLMSMLAVDPILDEEWGWLIGEVHDSILLEVRDDKIDELIPKILEIMAHPPLLDKLGIKLSIPIKAEAKVGQSLGSAKEYVVPERMAA